MDHLAYIYIYTHTCVCERERDLFIYIYKSTPFKSLNWEKRTKKNLGRKKRNRLV